MMRGIVKLPLFQLIKWIVKQMQVGCSSDLKSFPKFFSHIWVKRCQWNLRKKAIKKHEFINCEWIFADSKPNIQLVSSFYKLARKILRNRHKQTLLLLPISSDSHTFYLRNNKETILTILQARLATVIWIFAPRSLTYRHRCKPWFLTIVAKRLSIL